MSNSNKIFAYLIGLLFLIAGLGIALEMFSIPFSSVVLLLIGVLIWCLYFKLNINVLKYMGCFFLPAGIAYFLISAFRLSGVANFIAIYTSLICSFIFVYFISRKKVYLFISLIITLFVLHSITASNDNAREFIIAYDCLYIGLLSTILYVFEHKTLRYTPLWVACIVYLCGVLHFLNILKIITPLMFKLFISLFFVAIGGGIILYNYIKSKFDNKENHCE